MRNKPLKSTHDNVKGRPADKIINNNCHQSIYRVLCPLIELKGVISFEEYLSASLCRRQYRRMYQCVVDRGKARYRARKTPHTTRG